MILCIFLHGRIAISEYFLRCYCDAVLQGWKNSWEQDIETGIRRMKCTQALIDWEKGLIAAAAVVFVLTCLLLIWFLIKRLTHKPSWYYKKMINKHRFQSVPKEGPFSVVITDIEGYSGKVGRYRGNHFFILYMLSMSVIGAHT